MTDVLVIGGGPAGAAVAITLASAGREVLLLEKGIASRKKVCGEFFSPECGVDHERLGAEEAIARLEGMPVRTVLLSAPSSGEASFSLPEIEGHRGMALSRCAHDEAILARAAECGVEVRQGADVRSLRRERDRVIAGGPGFREEADIAIDASGRHPISRAGEASPRARSRPLGFRAYFDGMAVSPEAVELHMVRGAYVGAVEVAANRTNVCLLASPERVRAVGGNADDLLEKIAHENPVLRERLVNARRACPWDSVGAAVSGFRGIRSRAALCVGDAAGTVEPFSGEGIAMALRGGRLLAEALIAGTEGAADRFARAWKRQFLSRVRAGQALRLFAMRPPLAGMLVRLVDRHPRVGEWLVRATR